MKLNPEHYILRNYRVTFRRSRAKDAELKGEPMTFGPAQRKSFYFVSALLWFMVLLVLATIIFTAPWRVKPELLGPIVLLWGFAFVVALVVTAVLADEFFAVLHVYENGVDWRSPLRAKRYFFHQLESLCMGSQGNMRVRINCYEFRQQGRTVLKLPLPRYHNLGYLERVFIEGHPWVERVQTDRDDV